MPASTSARLTVVSCLLGSLAFATAARANMISNPGFETGLLAPSFQALDYGGATNWMVSTADAHTGSYSATAQGNKLVFQYFAATPTSNITNVSVWIKNPQGLNNAVYLEYSDFTSAAGLISATHSWQYVDVTSWLAPGKSLTGLGVWGFSQGGTDERTYTDDWQVIVMPEPTTLALAVGGMMLSRRRRM